MIKGSPQTSMPALNNYSGRFSLAFIGQFLDNKQNNTVLISRILKIRAGRVKMLKDKKLNNSVVDLEEWGFVAPLRDEGKKEYYENRAKTLPSETREVITSPINSLG